MSIPESILKTLAQCLTIGKRPIELHEPVFQGSEWKFVKTCIDERMVSSIGKYVDKFEQLLSQFTGLKHATAVVNGTAALHIALKLVGVRAEDEVLVPTLTFIGVPNSVSYCNAIPHFTDSEPQSFAIDPVKLRAYLKRIAIKRRHSCTNKITGRRISALIAVHVFGHPARIEEIQDVCREFNIVLIEDAAEALGSYYQDRHVGSWGKVSCLSFNGNKTITTGGGGAIITDDRILAKLAKHITTTAKVSHPWEYRHDYIGYNYRLPNINAALGCAQLQRLPKLLLLKRKLAERYGRAFRENDAVSFVEEPTYGRSNYWLNAILLNPEHSRLRDSILELTHKNRIKTRPVWRLMHRLPIYSKCPRMDLSIAEDLEKRIINIPSSAFL